MSRPATTKATGQVAPSRPTASAELTLDPPDAAGWQEFRALSHRAIDDMIDYLSSVRNRPAWRSFPEASRRHLAQSAPREGAPLARVYEEFREHILPYPTGNIHPSFWGWVMGT